MPAHPSISIAACALHRFRRDRNGVAAIEFAFIAAPFLTLMFAIIETALALLASTALETATQDTARLIMTGQAQMSEMSAAQFKTSLCTRLTGMMDCENGVDVDVQSSQSVSDIKLQKPIDDNGNYTVTPEFNPGRAGDIVVVRTFYQWPVFVPGLGFNAGNLNNNKRLLVGVATFRNEPGPF
ncbi:TadE/TadG family type IV pilus assembly protein [Bradyrhizobium sp. LHD-71]|uniref:TadE/TadG family type IV pilus assembly protein n=1 Tax=Bradyrhizobium sp. LHD-71 TaxID=3072141 RepID=UPI00280F58F0|nr:TadE/TadG family type IV pilus assembly protein [Bradyrhizobium sp. LHD-71]MDQ8727017.1 TadE/TadG family type IV pilus assembly protein [Bradyrhizobium sp. LHD-71]